MAYLKAHRGPTHGLAVLPALAAAIAGGLKAISPAAPFWPLFWFALLGCLSHVLFDFGNDYGTQGLWPFSRRWIALDFIPLVDIGLLLIIGTGWLLDPLPVGRGPLFAGVWLAIAVYVGLRCALHQRAAALVAARFRLAPGTAERAAPGPGWREQQLTIHPTFLSWNAWRYVLQQPGEFWTGMVWVLDGQVSEPERAANRCDRVVLASLQSGLVTHFADWVRRPRVDVARRGDLWEVRWSDMRYEVDGFAPFTAYAWLDRDLKLIDEGLKGRNDPAMSSRRWLRRLQLEMGRRGQMGN